MKKAHQNKNNEQYANKKTHQNKNNKEYADEESPTKQE